MILVFFFCTILTENLIKFIKIQNITKKKPISPQIKSFFLLTDFRPKNSQKRRKKVSRIWDFFFLLKKRQKRRILPAETEQIRDFQKMPTIVDYAPVQAGLDIFIKKNKFESGIAKKNEYHDHIGA